MNYDQPHKVYCYKLAKYLEKISYESNILPAPNYVRSNPILNTQLIKGWEISHLLINTPILNTEDKLDFYYNLEKSLSLLIKLQSWSLNIGDKIIDLDVVNLDLIDFNKYVYSYWSRKGYTVQEIIGEYFLVTEPLGREYKIDSYNCTCGKFSCLHLYLVNLYRTNNNVRKILIHKT